MLDNALSPQQLLTIALLLGGVVLLLLSLGRLRAAQRTGFWRARRRNIRLGAYGLMLAASLLLAGLGLLLGGGGFAPAPVEPTPTPDLDATIQAAVTMTLAAQPSMTVEASATPEATAMATAAATATHTMRASDTPTPATDTPRIPAATATATATASPTPSLTPTETPTATPSPTPLPTVTPTPSLTPAFITTPPTSAVEPPAEASLRVVGLAADKLPDIQRPSLPPQLAAGARRLYFVLDYSGMRPGVTWTRVLYYEGVPMQGGAYFWGAQPDGRLIIFFGDGRGYPAGGYELRLYLGERLIDSAAFRLE